MRKATAFDGKGEGPRQYGQEVEERRFRAHLVPDRHAGRLEWNTAHHMKHMHAYTHDAHASIMSHTNRTVHLRAVRRPDKKRCDLLQSRLSPFLLCEARGRAEHKS